MKIAITGASGFIGRRLLEAMNDHELTALQRGAPAPEGAEAVIHLAGEPVAQRWTAAAKDRIRESRVGGTRRLVDSFGRLQPPPRVLICASAIGYYGSRGDEVLTEDAAPGSGFLSEVCVAWEREADRARALGIRVVKFRTAMVLGPSGGALAKMLPAFRFGLGGPLGDGRQWMSWIHREDLINLIRYAVEQPISGAVNACAPEPVTNAEFTRVLARAVRRPAVLRMPAFGLRLLFGEMAEMLLDSQRVIPAAAQNAGFSFVYNELEPALRNVVGG
jgi:uncharacterized protein (TIGR01777 family)